MCQRKEEHSMCVMMPSLLQDGIMKGIPIYCQIKYPLDQAEEFGENAKKGMNGWQAQITEAKDQVVLIVVISSPA